MAYVATEPQVVVYKATNVVNGNSYIGYTGRGLTYRKGQHLRTAASGGGYRLHQAMRKHGADKIHFEIMMDFQGDKELALLYEIEAIAAYKPAYNIAEGGRGASSKPGTRMFSTEHRANLSKAMTGKKQTWVQVHSPERRAKVSAAHKGNTYWAGKKHRPETKAKIRAKGLKRTRPELWVAVKCLNDGRVFPNAGLAAEFYGVQRAWLRMCINRKRAMGNGLVFIDVLNED